MIEKSLAECWAKSSTIRVPQIGEIWSYKENSYEIIDCCIVKTDREGSDNGWDKGVIYKAMYDCPVKSKFVRELQDFQNKFTYGDVNE